MTADLKPGDLVYLDGDTTQVWRIVDFHKGLARLAPVTRTGRAAHPTRLSPAQVAQ